MHPGPNPLPSGRGAIFRDAYGIPHLWADTVDDLAYVQGYEAAYERAWQLELGRWRAEGRSAAVLGASALDWDIFARRARLCDTAQRAFIRLDGRTRAWCTAYVEGVNDGLPEGAADSAELATLGAEPGRWHAWSPLAVFAGIHILFGTCQYKLWREHVTATIGADLVDLFGAEGGAAGGSNAFAVTGRHSPTGMPLIAGDPHRSLEVPNVYQQVRLACPAFDVVGLAFPGVPGIAHFGHAGSVAWATTNAMADYQDLYVENLRLDPETATVQASGPDGWEPVAHHRDRVEVRHAEPVPIELVETSRGPVVLGEPATDGIEGSGPRVPSSARPELVEGSRGFDKLGPRTSERSGFDENGPRSRSGRAYSLRTPSRVELDLGFAALLSLLHARTVSDVEAAMTSWLEPVNVLVIGDSSGRLRERVVGLVPDRSAENRLLPAPPSDRARVWTGRYLHPTGHDREVVVNANDRASGVGLGFDYALPERSRRIRRLIEEGAAFDPVGLGAVCLDTDQPAAATMRTLLSEPADDLSPEASAVRDELLAWDGRADADSRRAALFAAWRSALVSWLLTQPRLNGLLATTTLPALFARWVDPAIRVGAAWEQLIRSAERLGIDATAGVRLALEQAATEPHPDSWGATHRFAPLHPLSGRRGGPEPPETPLAGDSGCVLATRSYPGLTDACSFGPVARYVWDLAERDRSRWVVPLGSSARSSSPHRIDQLAAWSSGETMPIVTAWERLRLDRVLPRRSESGRDPRRLTAPRGQDSSLA